MEAGSKKKRLPLQQYNGKAIKILEVECNAFVKSKFNQRIISTFAVRLSDIESMPLLIYNDKHSQEDGNFHSLYKYWYL